nr:MAG: hypothetical protein DiTV3a_F12ORF2 [Diabrotica toursvirus 3a]
MFNNNFRNLYFNFLKKNIGISFDKKISGSGNVQGSCGSLKFKLLKTTNVTPSDDIFYTDCRELVSDPMIDKIFFKYGIHNMTLGRHEFIVASQIMNNCSHLPNFLRAIIYIKNRFLNDHEDNPFNGTYSDNTCCSDIILYEHFSEYSSLYEILQNSSNVSVKFLNNLFLQLLLAVICAQQTSRFVHNDLHSGNVLIIKCNVKTHLLYRVTLLGKEKYFLINPQGFLPVIIDYGFAYSSDCENMSLECADSDKYGLITYQFDSLSDLIRLFVVMGSSCYNSKVSDHIHNLLCDLPIDMETSWENIFHKDSTSFASEIFFKHFKYNRTNITETYFKLILRVILLPISHDEKVTTINFEDELEKFFDEWNQIELWCKYDFQKLYLFRELTDLTRKYYPNTDIISYEMKNNFDGIFKNVSLFVNWNILCKSLNNIAGWLGNVIFQRIKYVEKKRSEILYKKLVSGEHMVNDIINLLYSETKHISKDDVVVVIDNIVSSNAVFTMDKDFAGTSEELWSYFENEL